MKKRYSVPTVAEQEIVTTNFIADSVNCRVNQQVQHYEINL